MLELIKGHVIELVQAEAFAPIYVKPAVKGPIEDELLDDDQAENDITYE